MSSSMTAVRLASRYVNARSPLSIEQTGNLRKFVIHSGLICAIAMLVMLVIANGSAQTRVAIQDVDVAFELTCAPPEPSFRTVDKLMPLKFEEGARPALAAKKLTAKTNKLTDQQLKVAASAKSLVPSRAINEMAPTALVTPSTADVVKLNPFAGTAANAASPVTQSASSADGVTQEGVGGAGSSQGMGDTNSLAGGDFGQNRGLAMAPPPVALGNIGPYKRDLIARLRQNWHPASDYDQVVVQIALDRDGNILGKELLQSTGFNQADQELLTAIEATQFAPLPDWYKGRRLTVKLVLKST